MPGSRPTEGGGPVGPKVQIHHCIPLHQGFERYQVTIGLGSLVLSGVKVLRQLDEWWTVFPRVPKLDANKKAMPRKGGGHITNPVIDIPNPESKRRFDAAVMAALTIHLSNQEAS